MLDVLRRMGRHYLHKCLKTLEVIDSTGSFHEWQADTFFLRLKQPKVGMGTGMVGADVSSTWEAQPPPSKQLLFTDCWRRDQKTCSQSKMQRAHTVREGEPRSDRWWSQLFWASCWIHSHLCIAEGRTREGRDGRRRCGFSCKEGRAAREEGRIKVISRMMKNELDESDVGDRDDHDCGSAWEEWWARW